MRLRTYLHTAWRWLAAQISRANDALRRFARWAKHEVAVWRRVIRHPRTPWYGKTLLVFALAYAAVPFDLIPDFVPILGVLDDVVLVGVPVWLAWKLVPRWIVAESRARS